jgi:two-component system OmpR family response regulator
MKQQLNILVVEDDPNLGTLLTEYLNAKGYKATLANNGQEGYDLFKAQSFNFLILDVMMPIKDGFTLAKEIRQIDTDVPILFLTAKSMKEDTLNGFKAGADDYMTKPFSMEELIARMQAILRRVGNSQLEDESNYAIGNFGFDKTKQLLTIEEKAIKLTTKENDLLYLLCKNMNGVLERDAALKFIWGDDNYFNGRSMDVYIAKLRKYLKEDPAIELINVHGRGFKLLVS